MTEEIKRRSAVTFESILGSKRASTTSDDWRGFARGVIEKVGPEAISDPKDDDAFGLAEPLAGKSQFVEDQVELSKKYPEAALSMKVFNSAIRKMDEESFVKNIFTCDAPFNGTVLKLNNSFMALSPEKDCLSSLRGAFLANEYKRFEGHYRKSGFIGGESLVPLMAYIGKTGRVIYRFYEVTVSESLRTSQVDSLVELPEKEAFEVIAGFKPYVNSLMEHYDDSVAAKLGRKDELTEIINEVLFDADETKGSW